MPGRGRRLWANSKKEEFRRHGPDPGRDKKGLLATNTYGQRGNENNPALFEGLRLGNLYQPGAGYTAGDCFGPFPLPRPGYNHKPGKHQHGFTTGGSGPFCDYHALAGWAPGSSSPSLYPISYGYCPDHYSRPYYNRAFSGCHTATGPQTPLTDQGPGSKQTPDGMVSLARGPITPFSRNDGWVWRGNI